jgi:cholesterol transport system auxiliary component
MSKWRGMTRCAAVAMMVCGALSACSLGQKTEQPATYDLGAPRSQTAAKPGIAAVLYLPDVTAPAWLNGPGIVYRLSYENPARPQPYALSRWSTSPASLLTERLRSRFAAAAAKGIVTGPDGVRADYLLRVELEDFSQSFDAPNSSRVALQARASLVNLATRALVAQQPFAVEQAAPTPDAPGAVQALSIASEEFLEALLKWTEQQLKAAGGK